MTKTYLGAAAAEEREAILEAVTGLFRRADRSGAAMLVEGEASGYSLRRLRVERARYENRLAEAALARRDARRRLTLLILPEGEQAEAAPVPGLREAPAVPALDVVLARTHIHRAELRAAQAEVEAARAARAHARHERRPEPTVTAGFKQQSDGLRGLYLSVAAPLPVLDRNRGRIEAASARLHAAETRLMLTARQVENDVARTYDRYAALAGRYTLISGELLGETEALLHAARVSYDEGEMTLVELLDAAEAYRDARLSTLDLSLELHVAYHDLRRAAGGSID